MPRLVSAAAVLSLVLGSASIVPAQVLTSTEPVQPPPFVPPPCTPPGPFTDVPHQDPFCPWIQQLVNDQITAGCGGSSYCPGAALTRAQMAVFLEVAMRGSSTWSPFPTGAVMFFNLPACPAGWSDLVQAQGRYVVGLPAGGALAGTAGTALANLENRPTGQHDHTVTDPGHTHSYVNNGVFQNYCGSNFCQTQYGANQTTGSSTTGIAVNPSGAVAGTNAPYIQLRVCQKD